MYRWFRPAGGLAAALLCAGLFACSPAVELPVVTRCDRAVSSIRNFSPAEVDSAGCVLYVARDGRLCWRALHDAASGVLIDDGKRTVTAAAASEDAVFFLYNSASGTALGRIDGRGRIAYDLCPDLPAGTERLCFSAGELFCADAAGNCFRLAELTRAEPVPVGNIWALTADAIIFADGAELRACLRADYATITALASMPGGVPIAAVAIDQATEEETRIYVMDEEGQVASFADGGWSLHGAPWPDADPASLAVVGDGCLITDPDGVWYIDAAGGGVTRVCDPGEIFAAEEQVYPAPYDGAAIDIASPSPLHAKGRS